MEIIIEDNIRSVAPQLLVAAIEAEVVNVETSDELWSELTNEAVAIAGRYELSDINKRPAVLSTREVYKKLGKEPNRYRPSCEALCRRAVKGMELYRINALVDLINLISMRSGYSIGGFDAGKIVGDRLRLGVGREGEVFNAIGRGVLNIAGLPVYRDAIGGIGTPTSDEERTKLTLSTTRLLMCVNVYGEELPIESTVGLSVSLLKKYCLADNVTIKYYRP